MICQTIRMASVNVQSLNFFTIIDNASLCQVTVLNSHTSTVTALTSSQTDRQRDSQTDGQTERQTDRHTDRDTDRQTDRQRYRETNEASDWQNKWATNPGGSGCSKLVCGAAVVFDASITINTASIMHNAQCRQQKDSD